MRVVNSFKKLAVALGCAKSEKDVHGANVAEVVNYITDNLPKTSKSTKTEK